MFEPYDGKLSSAVLRGEEGRKPLSLPGTKKGAAKPPLWPKASLNRAKLLEQSIDVHHIPVLSKLAVVNAKNVNGIEGILLS